MTDKIDVGCWDLRGKDLQSRYAAFARLPLSVEHHSILALATRVCKEGYGDQFIGDKAWLTIVSGTDRYADQLKDWARGFLEAVSSVRPRKSNRKLIESYSPEWGNTAALDGLQIAVIGQCAESLKSRAKQFNMNRDPYRKARNYTAGAILLQARQFESELAWSAEYHRKYT